MKFSFEPFTTGGRSRRPHTSPLEDSLIGCIFSPFPESTTRKPPRSSRSSCTAMWEAPKQLPGAMSGVSGGPKSSVSFSACSLTHETLGFGLVWKTSKPQNKRRTDCPSGEPASRPTPGEADARGRPAAPLRLAALLRTLPGPVGVDPLIPPGSGFKGKHKGTPPDLRVPFFETHPWGCKVFFFPGH